MRKIVDKYSLDFDEIVASGKQVIKEKVEEKIQVYLEKTLEENTTTKLRYIKEYKKKDYITEMQFAEYHNDENKTKYDRSQV